MDTEHFGQGNINEQKTHVDQLPESRECNAQIHPPHGAQVGEQLDELIFARFDDVPKVAF